jgi:uncharacterized protein YneF (UPF0154 family)
MKSEEKECRFLHVAINSNLFSEWKKFRKSLKIERGPLEEQALMEYMKKNGWKLNMKKIKKGEKLCQEKKN